MPSDLRHLLASLDYRFLLVTRGAPDDFGSFDVGGEARTPVAIVRHLSGLIDLIQEQFGLVVEHSAIDGSFEDECRTFRDKLAGLDAGLVAGRTFSPAREGFDYAGLLQGPVSDALTHVGQLALLRRLAGSPVERVRYWQVEMPHPASRRT
jgi:hypothetical protein